MMVCVFRLGVLLGILTCSLCWKLSITMKAAKVRSHKVYSTTITSSKQILQATPLKKTKREKNRSFLPPGYVIGDIRRLEHIHTLLSGQLTLARFLDSRYLRYWSGRTSDLRDIWEDMSKQPTSVIEFEELPELLRRLDDVTKLITEQMEQESLEWMENDLEHDMLVRYFSQNSNEGLLSLQSFISWDKIKSEMWYNSKSISVATISTRWALVAGSIESSVDFEQFCALHDEICMADYVI